MGKLAETDAERDARFLERIKRSMVRCDSCPKDAEGYPPAADLKGWIDGDEEGRRTIYIYQCPVCKTIVVTGQC